MVWCYIGIESVILHWNLSVGCFCTSEFERGVALYQNVREMYYISPAIELPWLPYIISMFWILNYPVSLSTSFVKMYVNYA